MMQSYKSKSDLLFSVLIIGLISSASFLLSTYSMSAWAARVTPVQAPIISYSAAVTQAAPAVVSIYTRQKLTNLRGFYGRQTMPFSPRQPGLQSDNMSLGSGVIMDKSGYIITNYHVIRNADKIDVALHDGRKAKARVIGTDPEVDLAILKINLKNLPVIKVNKESSAVGDVVLAIGNPYGVGQTITQGIVSALGRTRLRITNYDNLIQTDAAVNPGNSGGALVNSRGQLVGINTAIFSRTGGFDGIGFAIPVSTVENVLAQIVKTGHVTRGWLGVGIQPVQLERNQQNVHGVLVTSLSSQGPADDAGVHIGDIILKVNGQEVDGAEGLARLVAQLTPGKQAKLAILRNNRVNQLIVKIGARPKLRS
ncbi:putative periplasmic serine endoprotease DegP-like precursor [Piscirickettsia salmonis]|nr:trypsin-like peptidase domain-containing protein [Piscirickettsia salmonis]QGP48712.1 putative periplasmic serine endoprotease DegP-like precursor [Piscirickettsia salmonis]QGP52745.1 putative periplasmic serine endoprotease DegP-like precursor [Piscirickettsia salmonis]QGP57608.1 putative periplasmic serine endoprotease DegP-like precursor [Piscirickettsia salmonis]QGP62313.1 putative periplasmic serine endoprotease DegP-like precursor [Piscirickettsia salmonis]